MIFQTFYVRLLSFALAFVALLSLVTCGGGGSSSSSTTPVSGFATRIYLLNSYFGTVVIMNGANDQFYSSVITVGGGANLFAESLDQKITLVSAPTNASVISIDNATEAVANTVFLPAKTESFSVLSDNATGIAAVRNAPVTNQSTGAVMLLDIANNKVSATIPVPLVRYLSLNKARTKVLAFAENSDSVYVIDTSAKTATPVPGFDRPVAAVFTSDDTKAYIINCGPECGGTTASVTLFDTSNNTLGVNIPVTAGTVGLIDNGKLYVAGSANNIGALDVIDTSTNTRTQTGVVIANGYHTRMAMATGSNLYIGANTCTNQTTGCLTIYNAGNNQALQSSKLGDVNGIQTLNDRNLVYVSTGGELVIYDATTSQPRPNNQFDVVGYAGDVKQINP